MSTEQSDFFDAVLAVVVKAKMSVAFSEKEENGCGVRWGVWPVELWFGKERVDQA
jgi:hypothetical protein